MNVNTAVKQREDLFKIVLDTVSDGVTVIDNDLKIQYQNKIVVQLFGSKIGEHCYAAYRRRKEPCRDWRFIPSASLGGDSFGYHWIDEDHFAAYLIDVSGHGWVAALLSVSVYSFFLTVFSILQKAMDQSGDLTSF
jgi:hypothetical protein